MKTSITFEIDTDSLGGYTDEYIAALWYIAQANPAPIEDRDASRLAEWVGREIIKRWMATTPVPLWNHQGRHAPAMELAALKEKMKEGVQA